MNLHKLIHNSRNLYWVSDSRPCTPCRLGYPGGNREHHSCAAAFLGGSENRTQPNRVFYCECGTCELTTPTTYHYFICVTDRATCPECQTNTHPTPP